MRLRQPGDDRVVLRVMRVLRGVQQPSTIVILPIIDLVARSKDKAQVLGELQRHWIIEAANKQRGAVAEFCKRDVVWKALLKALFLASQASNDVGDSSNVAKGNEAVFGRGQITAFYGCIRRQRHEELLA